jgi:SpoVK/Ycf46/Vps4 family AAA+-type ATPase
LIRRGLDDIQEETNVIFNMLASLERVVVLLDEFDEMVRERTSTQSEVLSRFLTTAMLPKLARIAERRRIMFIVATNHINEFDAAIRRPGRFDLVFQIMPPSIKEKMKHEPSIKKKCADLLTDEIKAKIAALTFAEFTELASTVKSARNADKATAMIAKAYDRCTLAQQVHPLQGSEVSEHTWEMKCADESKLVRVPAI